MALSKVMRAALEAVARGGAYQNRIPFKRYTVTLDETGRERHGLYGEATFAAPRRRELIEYGDRVSFMLSRMPLAITDSGRAELEKKRK